MSGKTFVDTNILVYARDPGRPGKQALAHLWMARLWEQRSGRLSIQVLQEYYVTVTAKLKPGLPAALAREDVRNLALWNPVATDVRLLESAWSLADRYGFSWWDAQIVAAARRSGCDILLTEDMQNGQDIEGLIIVNPFAQGAPEPA
ncbi:MAG: VapC toxin family PIN domain ribonuclease [Hydrogenophilales bacterium 12-64-13]|nr:MAG: VapC toxin family PIN domain ribonuclease [Hydrogenophilales bacterium 12-64-13]